MIEKLFRILILFTVLNTAAYAYSQPFINYDYITGKTMNLFNVNTKVPFLIITPDARASALGDAGVSSTPDIHSLYWNPAKYAFYDDDILEEKREFFKTAVSYTPWLNENTNYINVTGVFRSNKNHAFAASIRHFGISKTPLSNFYTTQVHFPEHHNELAVDIAYSRKLSNNFSFAVAGRYIYSDIFKEQQIINNSKTKVGQSVAADIALYYQKWFDWNTPMRFAFGANISNIGSKISYIENTDGYFIPINLRLGSSFTFRIFQVSCLSFMVDFNKLLVPTPPIYARDENGQPIIDNDGNYVFEKGRDPHRSVFSGMLYSFSDAPGGIEEELQEIIISTGVEYSYNDRFILRAGYFHEHENKGGRKLYTAGVGMKYNFFAFDFSYSLPVNKTYYLDNVVRFTLAMHL